MTTKGDFQAGAIINKDFGLVDEQAPTSQSQRRYGC